MTRTDNPNYSISVDESFCKDKLDGFYSDPIDCAAYYHCSRERITRNRCPRGQVFNGILETCDNPANFPCHQRNVISAPSPSSDKVTSKTVDHRIEHRLDDNDKSSSDAKGMFMLIIE